MSGASGIEAQEMSASALLDAGLYHHQNGNFSQAEILYQKILQNDASHPNALHLLGLIRHQNGHNKEAIALISKAIAIRPSSPMYNHLAVALLSLGKSNEAEFSFRKAIELDAGDAEAHYNLANFLSQKNEINKAIGAYQKALEINPEYAEAHYNIGINLNKLDRLEEAVDHFRNAIRINPTHSKAMNNLGATLHRQELPAEAITSYQSAIALNPTDAELRNNIALSFQYLGQLDQAISAFQLALELKPGYTEAHSNLIFTLDMHPSMDVIALQRERKEWQKRYIESQIRAETSHSNSADHSKVIRIGYISADLRRHSAACVITPTLVDLDKKHFQSYVYSNSTGEDSYTHLIQNNVTSFKDITRLSDDEVAALIREDGIDILVDLSGHSGGNRLLVFARKPAPIQITAWGYIGGTGMKAMDYFFADPVVVPPDEKHLYTEEVIYLPNVVCYYPFEPFPPVNTLPALASGNVTFGSFNRRVKITQETFAVWAKVLLAVPNSRMILKTAELDQQGERDRIFDTFQRLGISSERIILQGKTSWTDHMAAFNQVDISLDPYPHGGGVTTLEGIMMGVPVVTLRWPTIPGRISAAILTPLGLTDWIAETPEQYVEITVNKASDLMALAILRKHLRNTMTSSLVGNPKAYAKEIEHQYRSLWEKWCQQNATIPEKLDEPDYINELAAILEKAMQFHHAGKVVEAEALYKKMLSVEPRHPDALHFLGLIEHQAGNFQSAADHIRQAISIIPTAPMYCNLGVVLQCLGQMEEAENCFMHAIQLYPDYIDAYYNCGVTMHAMEKYEESVECYQQVLRLNQDHVPALMNMGTSLHAIGQYDQAIQSFQRAIELQPTLADAHFNLGNAKKAQGQLKEAIDCYGQGLSLDPAHADAQYNLGLALQSEGRIEEAVDMLQQATSNNPNLFDAHITLGNIYFSQSKLDHALSSYQQAIALNPHNEQAQHGLGNVYFSRHSYEQAISCYEIALHVNPSSFEAMNSLGLTYFVLGNSYKALEYCKQAVTTNPHYALALANLGLIAHSIGNLSQAIDYYRRGIASDPDNSLAHSNLIFTMDMSPEIKVEELQIERKKWALQHSHAISTSDNKRATDDPSRKLRVGYVSADFKRHSATCVFMGMFLHFDPSMFEVYAYSNTPIEDEISERVRHNVTFFKDITRLSDDEVAALIREDGIDILVDLSGHSGGNRLLVFARKPAPIQITAWGYIGGTGMKAMDYFFADPVVVPPDEKHLYAEEVIYLPNVVCYSPPGTLEPIQSLPALRGDGLTFGSFNRLAKLTQETFAVWAKVLLAVPNSRMILKTAELDQQGERDRIFDTFQRLGISSERIILQGKTSWNAHMAAFNLVDISLDPYPHGGGVTTLEGIMMGVPVVTLRWPTIPGRISAAILTPLGLTDWIAETPEQYVEIAVNKASDLMALAILRKQLRNTMTSSLVGNPKAYAKEIEHQYRSLWEKWCKS